MKTLILVRHGDAYRDDVTLQDTERPLTPRGRRESAAAARRLASLVQRADVVVCSPARYALDTADIWQKILKIPAEHLQIKPEIYQAERVDILRVVRQLNDGNDTVVLVGHNPGVTALLHYLNGRSIEMMPQSSFAVISIDVDQWSRIALRDSELAHYYAPPADVKFNSLWERFILWRRQRVQKVELIMAFVIGLILILGVIAAVIFMGYGE